MGTFHLEKRALFGCWRKKNWGGGQVPPLPPPPPPVPPPLRPLLCGRLQTNLAKHKPSLIACCIQHDHPQLSYTQSVHQPFNLGGISSVCVCACMWYIRLLYVLTKYNLKSNTRHTIIQTESNSIHISFPFSGNNLCLIYVCIILRYKIQ